MPLLGGGNSLVRLLADQKRLYVLAELGDPNGLVSVASSSLGKTGSKLVLSGEHVRVELSDGGPVHVWALSPEQIAYASVDGKDATGGLGRACGGSQGPLADRAGDSP